MSATVFDLFTRQPVRTALEYDLCDQWLVGPDHRCQSYWREEFVLDMPVEVGGRVMSGHYQPGTWRFCRTHARIFKRDRVLDTRRHLQECEGFVWCDLHGEVHGDTLDYYDCGDDACCQENWRPLWMEKDK